MNLGRWIVAVLAVLTLVLNAPALARLTRSGCRMASSWRDGFRGASEQVDAARRMAARAHGEGRSVAYCRSSSRGLLPIERSRVLAMSWATMPEPVHAGDVASVVGSEAVVVAEFEPEIEKVLSASGYAAVASDGGLKLWERSPAGGEPISGASVVVWLEFLADTLLVTLGVMGFVWRSWTGFAYSLIVASVFGFVSPFLPRTFVLSVLCALVVVAAVGAGLRKNNRASRSPARISVFIVLALALLAVVYCSLALTHTFIAPNGLGTVGGRARLMFLSGGFPVGFFTDPKFALYEPAYPPGAAGLTLLAYVVAGVCGEWLVQVLPCLAMVALAGFMLTRVRSWAARVLILTLFLSPLTIRLATLYYPEVYMAICCLVGWERIRSDRLDWSGWFVLGAAGWFKNEGVIYFCALAAVWLMGTPTREWRCLMPRLPCGALLPLVWHIGCRCAGASLDGYHALAQLDVGKAFSAVAEILRYAFGHAWTYAFIFPLALVVMVRCGHDMYRLRSVMCTVLLACAGLVVIFSLSDAVDFDWHLESIERLLWVPALLLIREGLSERKCCHPSSNTLGIVGTRR